MAKVSNIIIGMLLLALTVSAFGSYFYGIDIEYEGNAYDNQTFDKYNRYAEIANLTDQLEEQTRFDQSQDTSIVDELNAFFGTMLTSLKTAWLSATSSTQIISNGISDLPLLGNNRAVFYGIGAVIITTVFVFIIISTVTKREQ